MDITTDFKTSKIGPKSWSQVLGYRPDDQAQLRKLGEMYAVMSIESTIDFDLANVGNFLFDELQSTYFNPQGSSDIKHFEKSLVSLKGRLDMMLEREGELAETGVDLQLAVVVVKDQVAYLAVVGEAKIFVSRGDDFAEIGAALIDAEQDGFLRSGSMYLNEDDRLLVATNHLLSMNSDQNISSALQKFDLRKVTVGKGAVLTLGVDIELPEVVEEEVVMPIPVPNVPQIPVSGVPQEVVIDDVKQNSLVEDKLIEPERDFLESENKLDEGFDDDYDLDSGEEDLGPSLIDRAGDVTDAIRGKLAGLYTSARAQVVARTNRPKYDDSELETEESSDNSSGVYEDEDLSLDDVYGKSVDEVSMISSYLNKGKDLLGSVADRLAPVISKAKDEFLRLIGRGQVDRQSVYLRGKSGVNYRLLAVVGLFVVVGLVLGLRKLSQDQERAEFVAKIETQVKSLDKEMRNLEVEVSTVSIGNASGGEKQDVVEKLDEVAQSATDLLDDGVGVDTLQKIIDTTSDAKDQVLNVRAFTEPDLVTDLGIKFEGTNPVDITYSKGNVYVADKAKNSIYRMKSALNSEAGVFADALKKPYLLVVDEDGDLVVAQDRNDSPSISTIDLDTGNPFNHPGLSKGQMGILAGMDVWSNGALYSVNAAKKILLKQENIGGGFQLPDDTNPWRRDNNFADLLDMEVDYWIFALIEGKGVRRYFSGEQVELSLDGLTPDDANAIKDASAIAITDRQFYIADTNNKRVLVFERDLQNDKIFHFKEQFVYRGKGEIFTNIKDLTVNPSTGHIFVLDGTKVIRLNG